MNKRARAWPLVLASIMAAIPSAHASAWSRDRGELMVISRADYFTSDLGAVSVGGSDVDGKFQRLESNTYVEYGLTNKLTVGGKVFYGSSWLTRGDHVETASGITEFETFAQYQISRNDLHALAVKLTGGIPTGFEAGARPSAEGDGADLEVSALYGRSLNFKPIKTFAAAEIGYRRRLGGAADQLRFLTTIGIEPGNRLAILFDVFSVISLRNEKLNALTLML